jgi:hypothetical protein
MAVPSDFPQKVQKQPMPDTLQGSRMAARLVKILQVCEREITAIFTSPIYAIPTATSFVSCIVWVN